MANAVSIGFEQILASSTEARESATNLPVQKDLKPIAPQESSKPIELQLFRGMGLCLRDAIALDLIMRPDINDLMARLDRHIHGGVLAPLTVFAMVISAARAGRARGHALAPALGRSLLDQCIARLPEDLRLEALLVFRCMHEAQSSDPTIQECEKRFVEHCARLAPQAQSERLREMCKMQWWHAAICNFAGHPAPERLRLTAVETLLAMLAPALQGKTEPVKRSCLTFLMENIVPIQAETPKEGPLDRDPWRKSVHAWSEAAFKLQPDTLAWVILNLQWSMSFESTGLWPHQAAIFLDVLTRLEGLRKEARQPAFRDMPSWLEAVFKQACRSMRDQPRLAVSLCMQMLRLIGPTDEAWAKAMNEDLRKAINGEPIAQEAEPGPGFPLESCKTQ